MSFLLYCLGVFFWFHLFNCSDIAAPIRQWVLARVHPNIGYAIQCAFCSTAWITLVLFSGGLVPPPYVFAAPVINLFLAKISDRLS